MSRLTDCHVIVLVHNGKRYYGPSVVESFISRRRGLSTSLFYGIQRIYSSIRFTTNFREILDYRNMLLSVNKKL